MQTPNKPRDSPPLAQGKQQHPPPTLLVLVGIPGSGKSTFAAQLTAVGWARVSQDDLGSRQACEAQTINYVLDNRDVIIDRCNFDPSQRKHWIDHGHALGCKIGVVVFSTPIHVCIDRINNRKHHPTLHPGPKVTSVVYSMANKLVFPSREEGFTFCRVIRDDADIPKVLTELLTKH